MKSASHSEARNYGIRLGAGKGAFFGGLAMMASGTIMPNLTATLMVFVLGGLHVLFGGLLWNQTNGMRWRLAVKNCPHVPVHLSQEERDCFVHRLIDAGVAGYFDPSKR